MSSKDILEQKHRQNNPQQKIKPTTSKDHAGVLTKLAPYATIGAKSAVDKQKAIHIESRVNLSAGRGNEKALGHGDKSLLDRSGEKGVKTLTTDDKSSKPKSIMKDNRANQEEKLKERNRKENNNTSNDKSEKTEIKAVSHTDNEDPLGNSSKNIQSNLENKLLELDSDIVVININEVANTTERDGNGGDRTSVEANNNTSNDGRHELPEGDTQSENSEGDKNAGSSTLAGMENTTGDDDEGRNKEATVDSSEGNVNGTARKKEGTRYMVGDVGPFYVIADLGNCELERDKNTDQRLSLGNLLRRNGVDNYSNITHTGGNKYKIEMTKAEDANKLVENRTLLGLGLDLFIPSSMANTDIIIKRVPTSMSTEELWENIVDPEHVIEIKRMKREKPS